MSRVVCRALALTLALAASGCAAAETSASAMRAYAAGDLAASMESVNEALGVHSSAALPRSLSATKTAALLDRASLLEATGRYGAGARDYGLALENAALLDAAGTPEELAAMVYPRGRGEFHATATELLAARSFEMLGHLVMGDMEEARRSARRFTTLRNHLYRTGADVEHVSFGSYLAGFVYERSGDAQVALAYYNEALRKRDFASLIEPVQHLAGETAVRGERVLAYLPPAVARGERTLEPRRANAELLVVVKLGRAPERELVDYTLTEAFARAGSYLQGDRAAIERTGHRTVRAPTLSRTQHEFDRASLRVDGKEIRIELAADLERELRAEHQHTLPKIVAGALRRMMNNEGPTWLDRPNLEAWSGMPARVLVGRVELPAGAHHVEVQLDGPAGQDVRGTYVEVPRGGFAVVDVTTLR